MTTVETTRRDEPDSGTTGAESGTPRVRAGVRLRDGATGGGRETDSASASALVTPRDKSWWVQRGKRLASCSPYTDRPPSVAEVVAYVRAGGFVPGEHPWWVEAPGYAYGALVAVPVTAVGYALMWIVQRPTRLLCVLFVAVLLALAWL